MRFRTAALLGGFGGYALFFLLFSGSDPSAGWGLTSGRAEAIARAGQLVSEFGESVSGWRSAVTIEERSLAGRFVQLQPSDPAAPLINPLRIGVWLRSPDGSSRWKVWMGPTGSFEEISQRSSGESEPLQPEESHAIARRALQQLVPEPDRFALLPDQPSGDGQDLRYRWELQDSGGESVPQVVVELRGSMIRQAKLEAEIPETFDDRETERRESMGILSVLVGILAVVSLLVGLAFYVSAIFRHLVHQPSLLVLIGVATFLHILAVLGGGPWDQQSMQDDTLPEALLLAGLLIVGVVAPCIAGVAGAGFSLTSSSLTEKRVTFELLLRKGPWVRGVAESLLYGWALAGWVGAVPLLVERIWGPQTVWLPSPDPSSLIAAVPVFPALDLFTRGEMLIWAIVFGLWYPLADRYLGRRWLQRPSQIALSALGLSILYLRAPLALALLTGLALALLADRLYWRRDLLAVLAVVPALLLARAGATHLVQPAASVQNWGLILLGLLLAPLPLFWWLSRKGVELDLDLEAQKRRQQAFRLENLRKAERERLLAEFSVARRAQQQMLPQSPPELPGYQLSAICQPAREVGGDFFEFVPLGERCWGVLVADVSGKGVPAALYMTLTKGLLRSLGGGDGNPPATIVSEVNRHLYEVAHRSVFVTMALGVVDPRRGSVDCFRAGHNPPIWRRAAKGENRIIRPSGLGLGLTSSRLFERSLAYETIPLEPGDALFFYSDGITEAMNRDGHEYGDDRLLETIARTDGLAADEARAMLLADVDHFLAGHPANDDITLLVLRAV